MTKSPKQQVEAVLAALNDLAHKAEEAANVGNDHGWSCIRGGKAIAYNYAVSLIKHECAEILANDP